MSRTQCAWSVVTVMLVVVMAMQNVRALSSENAWTEETPAGADKAIEGVGTEAEAGTKSRIAAGVERYELGKKTSEAIQEALELRDELEDEDINDDEEEDEELAPAVDYPPLGDEDSSRQVFSIRSRNGSRYRTLVFLPPTYNETVTYPLLVTTHGLGSSPEAHVAGFALDDLPEFASVIVAAPANYAQWLNADVRIAEDIVEYLRTRVNVGKVFIGGHSAGGYYAYRVAQSASIPNLAGALPIAGGGSGVRRGLPVAALHGSYDSVVPFSAGLAAIRGAARDNECDEDPSESTAIDGVTTTTWSNCEAPMIKLHTCRGAGHTPCVAQYKQIVKEFIDAVGRGS